MSARRVLRVIGLAFLCFALFLARPVLHLTRTVWNDIDDRRAPARGSMDDAGRLDATPVAEVWDIPPDPAAAEEQLQALIRRAAAAHLPVSIAGARHSMGGHTIARNGIVINMLPFRQVRFDEATGTVHVGAGARWFEVLDVLNARGRSVAIMQSNSDFSVGGSISVNCHGWQCRRPPIASSVEAFRILLAGGRIVRCSRGENKELFSLAFGGYGLFGVILDVELRTVPNERYRPERFVMPPREYAAAFAREVTPASDIGMSYGRLSVAPESFLNEATLNVFHRVPGSVPVISPTGFPESPALTRAFVRGEERSDYGKSLRWRVEQTLLPWIAPRAVDRNQLLSQPATVFENRSSQSTDILHEYFVPPSGFETFVGGLRAAVLKHHGDLLNVTIRDVQVDDDTFLRYADRDMLALVLYFTQPRTPEGEMSMEAMTRDIIDAARRSGGRYYLPYRLHATAEQFAAAYPQASRFFELKRRYDPQELFRNAFYEAYGSTTGSPRRAP
jgi:FAD/FMN-containing dehydrogenase